MNVNQATLDLIKEYEGFRAQTYLDSVGVPTIGYGTTAAAGVGIDPKPGMTITEAQACHYLELALNKFGAQIAPMIKAQLTPNQWGACLSLAYNIGPGNFLKSSVLRNINAGNMAAAAKSFALWNKAGGEVLAGLVRRRAAEAALFAKAG